MLIRPPKRRPRRRAPWRPFRARLAERLVWQTYHAHLLRVHRAILSDLGLRRDAAKPTPKGRVAAEHLGTQAQRRLERAAASIVSGVDAQLKTLPHIRPEALLGQGADATVASWRALNVNLIRTVGQQHLARVQAVLEDSPNLHVRDLTAKLQEALGVSRARARLWARDQTLKLNADIQQERQTRLGIKEYIWHATPDARTRPRHAELNGTHQLWSAPPDVGGGRHEPPGRDYQCRCYPEPVLPGEEQIVQTGEGLAPAPPKPAVAPVEFGVPVAPAAPPKSVEFPVPKAGTSEAVAFRAFGGFANFEKVCDALQTLQPGVRSEAAQDVIEGVVRRARFFPRAEGRGASQRGVAAVGGLKAKAQAPWEGGIDFDLASMKIAQNTRRPSLEHIAKLTEMQGRRIKSAADLVWFQGEDAEAVRIWGGAARTLLHEALHVCSPMTKSSYLGLSSRLEEGLVETMAAAWGRVIGRDSTAYLNERAAIRNAVEEAFGLTGADADAKVFAIAESMWQSPAAAAAYNSDAYIDLFVSHAKPPDPATFRASLVSKLEAIP
jgi:SPP1 gp7 family putative phage head morphogenesis protein